MQSIQFSTISNIDLMFKHPFCMTVAGPSQSGKTHFVTNLLQNLKNLINPIPEKIIYCYSAWQDKFDLLVNEIENIEFKKGLDDLDNIENSLVILDDLMTECVNDEEVVKLFTVGSHHQNASVIFLTQNIYEKGKYARAINLNSHYLVIFKNLRDQTQIMHLGRQLYPRNSCFFNEVFNDAINSQAFGYLIIDLMPNSTEFLRLRSFNFKTNEVFVYIKK